MKLDKITLIILAIIIGSFGRLILAGFPSVEPILPIVAFITILFGAEPGMIVGFLGYAISNFLLFGTIDFWSIFQGLGGVAAAVVISNLKLKKTGNDLLLATFIATIVFQLIINGVSILRGDDLLFALPFIAAHVISNLIFAALLFETISQYGKEKDEKKDKEEKKE
jgi:hypothetical protein